MATQFQHWTNRVTDGTGDLFWITADILIHKDNRNYARGEYFTLSVPDDASDDFRLCQELTNKRSWKLAYRLARVAIKYGKKNLCGIPSR